MEDAGDVRTLTRLASSGQDQASLSLAPCTSLELVIISCCLTAAPNSSPPNAQSNTAWLHELICSITSPELKGLSLDLDVSHIPDQSISHLVKAGREFMEQQQCSGIDAWLADARRFEHLQMVRIRLVCGREMPSPVDDLWRAKVATGFTSMFPLLHARRLLRCAVLCLPPIRKLICRA